MVYSGILSWRYAVTPSLGLPRALLPLSCPAPLLTAGETKSFTKSKTTLNEIGIRREAGRWADGEDRGCRIVFIGKRLDRAFLEEGFNSTAR